MSTRNQYSSARALNSVTFDQTCAHCGREFSGHGMPIQKALHQYKIHMKYAHRAEATPIAVRIDDRHVNHALRQLVNQNEVPAPETTIERAI